MWTRTTLNYSDSTNKVLYSVSKQGESSYAWIKYADDQLGNGMSNYPTGKAYYGIYVGNSPTAPTSPSAYTWSPTAKGLEDLKISYKAELKNTGDQIRADFTKEINNIDLHTKINGQHLIDQGWLSDTTNLPFETNNFDTIKSFEGDNFNFLRVNGYKTLLSPFIPYLKGLPFYYLAELYPEGGSAIYYLQILFYDENKVSLGANDLEVNLIGGSNVNGNTWTKFEGTRLVPTPDTRDNARYIRFRLITKYPGSSYQDGYTYFKQLMVKQLSQNYLKNGYVKASADGVMVGDDTTPVTSSLEATGLYIRNGNTLIANFADTGTYTPILYADKVVSDNVVGKLGDGRDRTVNLYVAPYSTGDGSGRDVYNKSNSIKNAMDYYFGQNGRWLDYVRLKINIDQGNYSEGVSLIGIGGHGFITFNFAPDTVWSGVWSFINVTPIVEFGSNRAVLIKGSQQNDNFLIMAFNAYVSIGNKVLDGSNPTSCRT